MALSFVPGNGFKEVFGIFQGGSAQPACPQTPPCWPYSSPRGPCCSSTCTFVPSSFWHAPGKIWEGQRWALVKVIWRVTGSPHSNPHCSFRTPLPPQIALAWGGCSTSFKGLPAVTRTVKKPAVLCKQHSAASQRALKKPGYRTDPFSL